MTDDYIDGFADAIALFAPLPVCVFVLLLACWTFGWWPFNG